MDIAKIVEQVVGKLKADPALLKSFAADPAKVVKSLEGVLGIDLPDEQIAAVIEGVKGKIDLSKIDIKQATGLLAKIKAFFGFGK